MPIETPPRVVIDTNVLVSFALSGRGATATLFGEILAGRLVPVVTREIIAEYREVVARADIGINHEAARVAVELLLAKSVRVVPAIWRGRLPDRDDEIFVHAALATGTRIITTHNTRHYPRTVCGPVWVMTPAQAVAWLRKRD